MQIRSTKRTDNAHRLPARNAVLRRRHPRVLLLHPGPDLPPPVHREETTIGRLEEEEEEKGVERRAGSNSSHR